MIRQFVVVGIGLCVEESLLAMFLVEQVDLPFQISAPSSSFVLSSTESLSTGQSFQDSLYFRYLVGLLSQKDQVNPRAFEKFHPRCVGYYWVRWRERSRRVPGHSLHPDDRSGGRSDCYRGLRRFG